jgi:hypothetical protein
LKKPFLIVLGINLGIILLLLPGILKDPDFGAVLGMTMLIAAVINGGLGVLLSLIGLAEKSMLRYGLALLTISGIYLLSGFTLCSQNRISVN